MWFVALLLVSLTVLSGFSVPRFLNGSSAAQSPTASPMSPPVAAQSPTSAGAAAALEGPLEQIYTQINHSVVNIQVRQTVDVTLPDLPEMPGYQFSVPQGQQTQEALGSGFVWDAEGYI